MTRRSVIASLTSIPVLGATSRSKQNKHYTIRPKDVVFLRYLLDYAGYKHVDPVEDLIGFGGPSGFAKSDRTLAFWFKKYDQSLHIELGLRPRQQPILCENYEDKGRVWLECLCDMGRDVLRLTACRPIMNVRTWRDPYKSA